MADDKKKDDNKKGDNKGDNSQPAAQGARNPELAAALAAYEAILVNWQIPITSALRQLMQQAAQHKMGTTEFILSLRQTKLYAKMFPGLMRKNGTLRMSEAQYMAGYNSARDAAGAVGRNLSREMYGVALANNQSPSEIKQRIVAVDKLKSYAPQFKEFNDYLLTTGQIKKPLTRGELLEFAMGTRKDFEQLWQNANTSFKMQELAGIDVGKPKLGNDLSYKELTGMIKRFESLGGDIEQVDFKKMGELIQDVVPKGALYGAGIRDRDIASMMLDGKNAPEIAKRVSNVLETYKAAVTEVSAHAPGYAGVVALGSPNRGSE